MCQHLWVGIGHCVTAKNFISPDHELEIEGQLLVVSMLVGVQVIHFFGVLALWVRDVSPPLKPFFSFTLVSFLREERRLHALIKVEVRKTRLTRLNSDLLFVKFTITIRIWPKKSGAFRMRNANHCKLLYPLVSLRMKTWNSFFFFW